MDKLAEDDFEYFLDKAYQAEIRDDRLEVMRMLRRLKLMEDALIIYELKRRIIL